MDHNNQKNTFSKILMISLVLGLLLVGSVSAMKIDYFYSPTCPYCQQVSPLIQELSNRFNFYNWNFYDISKGSYNINGVPNVKIKTNDCREIDLRGSLQIQKYLKCELQQMSTLDCPTSTKLNKGSYFIK